MKHNVCSHAEATYAHVHLHTVCSLLVLIYQRVDNEKQHLCFHPVFVSSAFIQMELLKCEGITLLDGASFTLVLFCCQGGLSSLLDPG